MTLAKAERAALCDLLDRVGPDAPTLCEGWDAHDLAAHLWIRETDPVGVSGMVARPLAGLLERRTAEVRGRWSYAELVDRVRRGPARLSVFAIPGVDEGASTTEFFVHHEDVRRAGEEPAAPRRLDAEDEEWLWRRLKLLARAFYRRSPVGVVLERSDGPLGPDGRPETIRASGGSETVTVVGRPGELVLHAHGRRAVADVRLVGEPAALEQLAGTDLHV